MVCCQQNGRSCFGFRADKLPHGPASFGIETSCRLIQNEEVRRTGNSKSELNSALLSSGKFATPAIREIDQPGLLNHLIGSHMAGIVARVQIDQLPHGQRLWQASGLKHYAHSGSCPAIARVQAKEADLAGIGCKASGQKPGNRRLTCAIGTKQRRYAPGLKFKAEFLQHALATI
jgi:hypothetical protein